MMPGHPSLAHTHRVVGGVASPHHTHAHTSWCVRACCAMMVAVLGGCACHRRVAAQPVSVVCGPLASVTKVVGELYRALRVLASVAPAVLPRRMAAGWRERQCTWAPRLTLGHAGELWRRDGCRPQRTACVAMCVACMKHVVCERERESARARACMRVRACPGVSGRWGDLGIRVCLCARSRMRRPIQLRARTHTRVHGCSTHTCAQTACEVTRVGVCVCVRARAHSRARVCVRARAFVCVCVCARMCECE